MELAQHEMRTTVAEREYQKLSRQLKAWTEKLEGRYRGEPGIWGIGCTVLMYYYTVL